MAIERLRVAVNGTPGGNGVCTFYALPGGGMQSAFKDFFLALTDVFPAAIQITVPSEGDVLDEVTGDLTGTWSEGTPLTYQGSNAAVFAGGVGAVVGWNTATIVDSPETAAGPRRVRGRSFIVPLASNQYQADGTLAAASQTGIQIAASNLVEAGAGSMVIWHRPRARAGGVAAPVTTAVVRDRVAFLSSRRS